MQAIPDPNSQEWLRASANIYSNSDLQLLSA